MAPRLGVIALFTLVHVFAILLSDTTALAIDGYIPSRATVYFPNTLTPCIFFEGIVKLEIDGKVFDAPDRIYAYGECAVYLEMFAEGFSIVLFIKHYNITDNPRSQFSVYQIQAILPSSTIWYSDVSVFEGTIDRAFECPRSTEFNLTQLWKQEIEVSVTSKTPEETTTAKANISSSPSPLLSQEYNTSSSIGKQITKASPDPDVFRRFGWTSERTVQPQQVRVILSMVSMRVYSSVEEAQKAVIASLEDIEAAEICKFPSPFSFTWFVVISAGLSAILLLSVLAAALRILPFTKA